MTPREIGAAAIWASDHDGACEWDEVSEPEQDLYLRNFDAAVVAYTHLAAEQGWHMRPDEATEEMDCAGLDDPNAGYCDRCMQSGHSRNAGWPDIIYRAMLAAAPKFEWDK
jgi:hypothetical protein